MGLCILITLPQGHCEHSARWEGKRDTRVSHPDSEMVIQSGILMSQRPQRGDLTPPIPHCRDRTLDQNARKTMLRLTLLGISPTPGKGTGEHRTAGPGASPPPGHQQQKWESSHFKITPAEKQPNHAEHSPVLNSSPPHPTPPLTSALQSTCSLTRGTSFHFQQRIPEIS